MNTKNSNSGNITRSSSQKICRACSVIIPLCFFALFLCAAFVSVTNDMYAFVKADDPVEITLSEPRTLKEVSELLQENGVIKNPAAFYIYVVSKDAEEQVCSFEGKLRLNSSMSYREILKSFQ